MTTQAMNQLIDMFCWLWNFKKQSWKSFSFNSIN